MTDDPQDFYDSQFELEDAEWDARCPQCGRYSLDCHDDH